MCSLCSCFDGLALLRRSAPPSRLPASQARPSSRLGQTPAIGRYVDERRSFGPVRPPRSISSIPFPTALITEEDLKDHPSCSICQEDFRVGEEYRRLPCLHIFHTTHIDEWLRRKEQCPLCNHRCAWTRHDPPTSAAGRQSDEWDQLRGDRVLDRRLRNEWEQLRADGCEVDGLLMQSCNLGTTPGVKMHLSVNLAGPEGSPYHGQVFVLDVQLCKDFPYLPPRLRFDTPILHPNVSPWTGELAIGESWSPSWSVYEVLLAVRRLLAEPDAERAADREAAEMYLHRREQFLRTVRAWTDPGAEADESRLLAAAMAEASAGDLAILGQATDVLESALGAVGSGSVCDAAAILNELALQCPRLQGLLQAYEWDGCQVNQQRLLVPLHTALALELGRETPDSLGVGRLAVWTPEGRGSGSAACGWDFMGTPIA